MICYVGSCKRRDMVGISSAESIAVWSKGKSKVNGRMRLEDVSEINESRGPAHLDSGGGVVNVRGIVILA